MWWEQILQQTHFFQSLHNIQVEVIIQLQIIDKIDQKFIFLPKYVWPKTADHKPIIGAIT